MKNVIWGIIVIVTIFSCSQNKKNASVIPNIEIGSVYLGGKVFYLFKNGDYGYVENEKHGFIYSNKVYKAIWGCQYVNTSYLRHSLGDGRENTSIIKDDCSGINAASICPNRWWLPDSIELRLLYNVKSLVSAPNEEFWVSDGYNQTNSTSINFLSGTNNLPLITDSLYVLPIKQF